MMPGILYRMYELVVQYSMRRGFGTTAVDQQFAVPGTGDSSAILLYCCCTGTENVFGKLSKDGFNADHPYDTAPKIFPAAEYSSLKIWSKVISHRATRRRSVQCKYSNT